MTKTKAKKTGRKDITVVLYGDLEERLAVVTSILEQIAALVDPAARRGMGKGHRSDAVRKALHLGLPILKQQAEEHLVRIREALEDTDPPATTN